MPLLLAPASVLKPHVGHTVDRRCLELDTVDLGIPRFHRPLGGSTSKRPTPTVSVGSIVHLKKTVGPTVSVGFKTEESELIQSC